MRIIGGLLIAFGVVDMVGSYTNLDVWGEWIRVDLPEVIWRFSAYIEIGVGYLLFNLGSKEAEADDSQVESEPTE